MKPEHILNTIESALLANCLAVAERTGIFTSIFASPKTPREVAFYSGVDETICDALVKVFEKAGILYRHENHVKFSNGYDELLGDPSSQYYLGSALRLMSGLLSVTDDITRALVSREGVSPYSYHDEFYSAMEQMSCGWIYSELVTEWIPQVEGLRERLEKGGNVAEIGCGGGSALLHVLDRFPKANGLGIDLMENNIERSRQGARWAQLDERTEFLNGDAANLLSGRFDLIMAFSVLHDVKNLDDVMFAALQSLSEDGVFLVVESVLSPEESSSSSMTLDSILLATSALYCVPVAKFNGSKQPIGTVGLTEEYIGERWASVGGGECCAISTEFENLRINVLKKARNEI